MTYMAEPQPATPYQGNAATSPVRFLAYRLARAQATPEEALRRPELVLEAGRTPWLRLLGTGTAAVLLFLAFFIHHRAWAIGDMGAIPRLVFWLLGVGFFDILLFHGHSAATTSTNIEIQWDCLKWTEGIEIGQLAWVDLTEAWLFHDPREGESTVEQTRRGGRRLILVDAHGQRLFVPERDAAFDALLARLKLERPDVPTRVVEPETESPEGDSLGQGDFERDLSEENDASEEPDATPDNSGGETDADEERERGEASS